MKNKVNQSLSSLKWSQGILGKHKVSIINLMILQIAISLMVTLYPMITLSLLNAIQAKNKELFSQRIILFSVFFLCQITLGLMNRIYTEKVRISIDIAFKQRFLGSWLKREDIVSSRFHSGDIMTRMTTDITNITDGFISVLPYLLAVTIRLMTTIILLYLLVPSLSILMMVGGLCLLGASFFVKKRMKGLHKEVNKTEGIFRSYLLEIFRNPILIKSFSIEKFVLRSSEHLLGDYQKTALTRNFFNSINQFVVGFSFSLALVSGALISGLGIMNGHLSLGVYIAVAQLIAQIMGPLTGVASFVSRYFNMTASIERLQEVNPFLDEKEIVFDDQEALRLKPPREIHFHQLSFCYEDDFTKVFEKFSVDIQSGKHTAIIGSSGGGKSTFLKILTGVYQPQGGEIILDYEDKTLVIDERLQGEYRRLFAFVPQGNALMSGSIRNCVTLGNEHFDDDKVWEVLDIACALEYVQKLPKGLDTVIEEAGSSLSEGQLQRLAIARALYANRPFLVLDESTSGLDMATEKKLLYNLSQLKDITIIVVTHRMEVLEICENTIDFNVIHKESVNESIKSIE